MGTVTIEVPEELLQSAGLTEEDLLVELAIHLYKEQRLTMGQARRMADLDINRFWAELDKRNLSVNYDENDLEQDLETIRYLMSAA